MTKDSKVTPEGAEISSVLRTAGAFFGEPRALETTERSKLKLFTYGEVTPSCGYRELTPNKCRGTILPFPVVISYYGVMIWKKTANLINLMKPFGIIIPIGRIPAIRQPTILRDGSEAVGSQIQFLAEPSEAYCEN